LSIPVPSTPTLFVARRLEWPRLFLPFSCRLSVVALGRRPCRALGEGPGGGPKRGRPGALDLGAPVAFNRIALRDRRVRATVLLAGQDRQVGRVIRVVRRRPRLPPLRRRAGRTPRARVGAGLPESTLPGTSVRRFGIYWTMALPEGAAARPRWPREPGDDGQPAGTHTCRGRLTAAPRGHAVPARPILSVRGDSTKQGRSPPWPRVEGRCRLWHRRRAGPGAGNPALALDCRSRHRRRFSAIESADTACVWRLAVGPRLHWRRRRECSAGWIPRRQGSGPSSSAPAHGTARAAALHGRRWPSATSVFARAHQAMTVAA
jgi:hypothetical protein